MSPPKMTSSGAHWAAGYIGLPWRKDGQGPDAFNCWTFVRHVQLTHFQRDLPLVDADPDRMPATVRLFRGHPERSRWQMVSKPAEGDCVLMAHARYPGHAGLWVDADGGGILHCMRGAGVVFTSPQALRAGGWRLVEYYRASY